MLNIAVCDDNLLSVKKILTVLKKYLAEINIEYNIDKYDDEFKMLGYIADGLKYDIFFCDIDMPIPGYHLMSEIRRYDDEFLLAFISNYESLGNVVCHARGDAYIYKSMSEETMLQEIKYILKLYLKDRQICTFRTAAGLIDMEVRKIKYIESRKREIIVHIKNGEYLTLIDTTLSELEHDNSFNSFSRVGRSYLINFKGVYAVKKSIQFSDGEELKFSKEKIDTFRREWLNFKFEEMK